MPPVLAQPLDFLGTALNSPSTRMLIGLVGVPGAGKTTLAAQWATHLNAAHGAVTAVPAATRIVIVEGLYLLHDDDGWEQVRGQLDACWYLDTPLPVAMDRLAQRHMQAWGFTREQADERIATNDGLNARLVADSAARADYLIGHRTPSSIR